MAGGRRGLLPRVVPALARPVRGGSPRPGWRVWRPARPPGRHRACRASLRFPFVALGVQGVALAGVRLVFELGDLGVVEVEGGGFGADTGQGEEVVAGRRAGGGPLQGAAVPPGVVDLYPLTNLG